MPCLEGLFDRPLERVTFDMLFIIQLWHTLGRLRLHTETTIKFMEGVTPLLGAAVRKWKRKVDRIQTRELAREIEVRRRREIARAAKEGRPADPVVEKKIKMFNLILAKWHGAGHFTEDIRNFGPVEIYSTQWVRLP